MGVHEELADRFESVRAPLRRMAYQMLGSAYEADDAVQEAWLRLAGSDASGIENLDGWLRTVTSRVCLDMLRSRHARREDLAGQQLPDNVQDHGHDPEREALLADSVGRALLVVLDTLTAAERVAFVLHDMFSVPFDEIARVVDRSPVATKKLASRARNKVRGTPAVDGTELLRRRAVVERFVAASRAGNIDAIIAVLDPDVIRRADRATTGAGRPAQEQGARTVAEEIKVFGRSAHLAELVLINGTVGLVIAPYGRLRTVLTFTITGDKISEYELISDPARFLELELAVLGRLPPRRRPWNPARHRSRTSLPRRHRTDEAERGETPQPAAFPAGVPDDFGR